MLGVLFSAVPVSSGSVSAFIGLEVGDLVNGGLVGCLVVGGLDGLLVTGGLDGFLVNGGLVGLDVLAKLGLGVACTMSSLEIVSSLSLSSLQAFTTVHKLSWSTPKYPSQHFVADG
jgi:hypothetical protein